MSVEQQILALALEARKRGIELPLPDRGDVHGYRWVERAKSILASQ